MPAELRDTIRGFFHHGGLTADIGCGSGRDVAWLNASGFPAVGYDAAQGMLSAARETFPGNQFHHDSLPDLGRVPAASYANVLCSGVLMHLRREDLITACMNLARILKPNGRLLLSYRASREGEERESDGRLFTSIPAGKLILLMESVGLRVIMETRQPDTTSPDVSWIVILAEKGPLDRATGLERVQSILVQDAKTATYKLALIRAFCKIGRTESHLVQWKGNTVYVPM